MRIAICVLLVGCATPMSALREDNRRLTQSVTDLRADRRAQDRKLRDLEHQLAMVKANTVSADMPSLPVEVVTPPKSATTATDARVVAVTEDGTEIIYEGDAAAGKPATLDDDEPRHMTSAPPTRAPDRLDHRARAPRAHVRGDLIVANDTAAAADYRNAVEFVTEAKYEQALAALRAFVKQYPRHEYADNAQYWVGEVYYAQKDYPHALTEFRATIETYPRGNKVPDALLKVGYCYQALGQTEKARAVLEQVVNLYPKSEPAALASKRLESK
jgi:tol-pal system protein YbgF